MDYRHKLRCLARVPTTIYHVWHINSSFLEARSNILCIILHKVCLSTMTKHEHGSLKLTTAIIVVNITVTLRICSFYCNLTR